MSLIIDFSERKKIEEINISKIAKICTKQSSNWEQNREFIDAKMIELYELDFISRNELTAVTGILPGGTKGNLKNKDGTRKDTRAIDSNECFVQQSTPYVYPLLKAHKLSIEELRNTLPDEVSTKIPARLVVGMSSCQMSRNCTVNLNTLKTLQLS